MSVYSTAAKNCPDSLATWTGSMWRSTKLMLCAKAAWATKGRGGQVHRTDLMPKKVNLERQRFRLGTSHGFAARERWNVCGCAFAGLTWGADMRDEGEEQQRWGSQAGKQGPGGEGGRRQRARLNGYHSIAHLFLWRPTTVFSGLICPGHIERGKREDTDYY